MSKNFDCETDSFIARLIKNNPGETEFHQAAYEIVETLIPYIADNNDYKHANILNRIMEPDRIITFKVDWENDQGDVQVDRAWRVQFNNAIGPYKGGLRFHPTVNQSVLKFLGLEQCFKNSLTGLPLGGAKGGSNFDPKNKSKGEIMRFCQSFMTGLSRHIGENTDIPAGDIGVGAREIGFLYGQYKRLNNKFVGAMTGKGLSYGGSEIRTEATGYGCVYFCESMLNHIGEGIADKTCVISGSGNVAIYAAEKAINLGAIVLTMSDSDGFIHDPEGINLEKLACIKKIKEINRERIVTYTHYYPKATYYAGKPWGVKCDIALPCATQNEINKNNAKELITNNVLAISEGANMPTDRIATKLFIENKVLFGPGKAANAGGVAVSGLEQTQNSMRLSWTKEKVDESLRDIMHNIHKRCIYYGQDKDLNMPNYIKGSNIAGFIKIANAMLAYGVA